MRPKGCATSDTKATSGAGCHSQGQNLYAYTNNQGSGQDTVAQWLEHCPRHMEDVSSAPAGSMLSFYLLSFAFFLPSISTFRLGTTNGLPYAFLGFVVC